MFLLVLGIVAIIVGAALQFLRHSFTKQWIKSSLNWEADWWFDTISFYLIPFLAVIGLTVLILTHHSRKVAEEAFQKEQEKVVILDERIEALNPHRQPITGGHATVQIVVKSDREVRAHASGQGAYVEFIKEGNRLLWGGSMAYDEIQSGKGFVYYTSDFILNVDSGHGLPIFSLRDTESIKLIFHAIPDNSEILGGGLWCTINNSISLAFSIPAQIAKGKEIIIPDIHKGLQALMPY